MKLFKSIFLLFISCAMFFSCEGTQHYYNVADIVEKSEAREYYEEKLHNVITANDYKNGKYLVSVFDKTSSTNSLLTDDFEVKIRDYTDLKAFSRTVENISKYCPAVSASGLIYFEKKNFSFTMLDYYGENKLSTGKFSFQMVDEEKEGVIEFITEDASLTGNILTVNEEKTIFDPLVKMIVDSVKSQDIFNDKSVQPIKKSVGETEYNVCWVSRNGVHENSDYTTLQVDVPKFVYNDKNGSLYFYILQYNIGSVSLVSIEGAIYYGSKKKFIYKDYDGKLKD